MSDDKMVTEREAVLREREAFERGHDCALVMRPDVLAFDVEVESVRRYPLPKVTRPRVVEDPHGGSFGTGFDRTFIYWKVDKSASESPKGNVVLVSADGYLLTPPTGWSPNLSPERIALWADLLANPTEECDAEVEA